MKALHSFNTSPAKMTTVVVPSPTCMQSTVHCSLSCVPLIFVIHQVRRMAESDKDAWFAGLLITSASCDIEMSASTFAAGCTMSSSFMMVAPSLDMVTRPCRGHAFSLHNLQDSHLACLFKTCEFRTCQQKPGMECALCRRAPACPFLWAPRWSSPYQQRPYRH